MAGKGHKLSEYMKPRKKKSKSHKNWSLFTTRDDDPIRDARLKSQGRNL